MIRLTHPVDAVEIKHCLNLKAYALIHERLRVILLAHQGMPRNEISKKLDRSSTFVTKWIKRFNEQGLDALKDRRAGNKMTKLTDEASSLLDSLLINGPSKESGMSRFRIKDLVILLEPHIGKIARATVWNWVKKKASHGLSRGQYMKKMTHK
jgi:transposase